MKDPRHKKGAGVSCHRCGLSRTNGAYCPIGFWMDKRQEKRLSCSTVMATTDGERLLRLHAFEQNELQKWLAKQDS